jgi:hypothetical protein
VECLTIKAVLSGTGYQPANLQNARRKREAQRVLDGIVQQFLPVEGKTIRLMT